MACEGRRGTQHAQSVGSARIGEGQTLIGAGHNRRSGNRSDVVSRRFPFYRSYSCEQFALPMKAPTPHEKAFGRMCFLLEDPLLNYRPLDDSDE
jgi:hypothetical protein|uniref:Uncharacterized protein n=2 Tax=Oryza sativa subsp. japonica TaxID=39947 RepID=Q6YW13_ORYSJ|nr:hypothetical protein [Oryza sativa Japonica Group]